MQWLYNIQPGVPTEFCSSHLQLFMENAGS